MPTQESNESASVEKIFPGVIPDFFQWDKRQATPAPPVPSRDMLGRVNKQPMLSREWILDIVRHAVVAQRCSLVLLPDIYLANLIWGHKDWPANWRQTIAGALWNCTPDIMPTTIECLLTDDEEDDFEVADEKKWRLGERNCCQACPLYGRHDLPHWHYRVILPEASWGVMEQFISRRLGENYVEFDFRNVKLKKEEVSTRKKELQNELATRLEVLEDHADPIFDEGLARLEIKAAAHELKNIKPGRHRVKDVLAFYLPARIFGPSPCAGLTPAMSNILKSLPMQITRDRGKNDRADKALVVHIDRTADCRPELPVPMYPDLENGHYVMFNGNSGRGYRRHGYGFKIATWKEDAGYATADKDVQFFRDLKHLPKQFGVVIVGWSKNDRQWRTLDDMIAMCTTTVGRKWLASCVLRAYAGADYLIRWRRYFADRLGFTSIPGGEDEDRLQPSTGTKETPTAIRSASDLQNWMNQRGLTDQRMADCLGVNRSSVNHYRTGRRPWSLKFQAKVAAYVATVET